MYKRSIHLFSVTLTVANFVGKWSLYIIAWDLVHDLLPSLEMQLLSAIFAFRHEIFQ